VEWEVNDIKSGGMFHLSIRKIIEILND